MTVGVPHIREGNTAELQISGLVLAARVVEWELHIRSAASSSTSFCADFAVADVCRVVERHTLKRKGYSYCPASRV